MGVGVGAGGFGAAPTPSRWSPQAPAAPGMLSSLQAFASEPIERGVDGWGVTRPGASQRARDGAGSSAASPPVASATEPASGTAPGAEAAAVSSASPSPFDAVVWGGAVEGRGHTAFVPGAGVVSSPQSLSGRFLAESHEQDARRSYASGGDVATLLPGSAGVATGAGGAGVPAATGEAAGVGVGRMRGPVGGTTSAPSLGMPGAGAREARGSDPVELRRQLLRQGRSARALAAPGPASATEGLRAAADAIV